MAHVRQQIRDAVVTELSGNISLVGANVFPSRVYDLTEDQLPCLLVYTTKEDDEVTTIDGVVVQRQIVIAVTAKVKTTTDFDDVVDTIAVDVEKILLTSTEPCLSSVALIGTEIELDESDQPIGSAEITFSVSVFTRAGNPEILL